MIWASRRASCSANSRLASEKGIRLSRVVEIEDAEYATFEDQRHRDGRLDVEAFANDLERLAVGLPTEPQGAAVFAATRPAIPWPSGTRILGHNSGSTPAATRTRSSRAA